MACASRSAAARDESPPPVLLWYSRDTQIDAKAALSIVQRRKEMEGRWGRVCEWSTFEPHLSAAERLHQFFALAGKTKVVFYYGHGITFENRFHFSLGDTGARPDEVSDSDFMSATKATPTEIVENWVLSCESVCCDMNFSQHNLLLQRPVVAIQQDGRFALDTNCMFFTCRTGMESKENVVVDGECTTVSEGFKLPRTGIFCLLRRSASLVLPKGGNLSYDLTDTEKVEFKKICDGQDASSLLDRTLNKRDVASWLKSVAVAEELEMEQFELKFDGKQILFKSAEVKHGKHTFTLHLHARKRSEDTVSANLNQLHLKTGHRHKSLKDNLLQNFSRRDASMVGSIFQRNVNGQMEEEGWTMNWE